MIPNVFLNIAQVNELRLIHGLRHDNLVSVFGHQKFGDSFYIFMEYVSEGTLQQLLSMCEALPLGTIQAYTTDIVRGLDYLHRHQIAHRDIKPNNLLITHQNNIKVRGTYDIIAFDSYIHVFERGWVKQNNK